MTDDELRQTILGTEARRMRQFGYKGVEAKDILKSKVLRAFLRHSLDDEEDVRWARGGEQMVRVRAALLAECDLA